MRLIYIAGPFNARKGVPVEQNVRFVEDLARALVSTYPDVQPVVPHSLGRVLFGYQEEAAAYAGTLELMRRCDAVVMQEAWEGSKGSCLERADALAQGLPVFEERDCFSDKGEEPRFFRWLQEQEARRG